MGEGRGEGRGSGMKNAKKRKIITAGAWRVNRRKTKGNSIEN